MGKKWIKRALYTTGALLSYSVIATAIYKKTDVVERSCSEGIALTFDDGPHPIYTPKLLDLLKVFQVKATFFVVGQHAEAYPEIIARMHEEGHAIGIHHYRHTSNWLLAPHQTKQEIERCAKVIEQITGERPILYRPPWGHLNLFTPLTAKNYRTVLWTRHFKDWRIAQIEHTLKDKMTNATKEGSVFLLHDNGQTLGAEEEAPRYMLAHLEQYLRQHADTTKFVVLR